MDFREYLYYLNKLKTNSIVDIEKEFKEDDGVTTCAYIPRYGDIVIKVDKSMCSYCGRSVDIYKKACDRGVGFLFAEIKKGLKINKNNFSFYQEKVPLTAGLYFNETDEGYDLSVYYNEVCVDYIYNYEMEIELDEKDYNDFEESYYVGEYNEYSIIDDMLCSLRITAELFGAIIDFYGEDVALDFLIFCFENTVNDLHNWNWGFLDGRPVIFDFAGYLPERAELEDH